MIPNLGSQAIKIFSAGLHLPPPSVKTIATCSDENRFENSDAKGSVTALEEALKNVCKYFDDNLINPVKVVRVVNIKLGFMD